MQKASCLPHTLVSVVLHTHRRTLPYPFAWNKNENGNVNVPAKVSLLLAIDLSGACSAVEVCEINFITAHLAHDFHAGSGTALAHDFTNCPK